MDFTRLSEAIAPLLSWYRGNRRVLPFREEPTPYRIWISEIMLQQTRVSAAVPYFERFVRELPSIEALAACEEEHLLKLWQGLGYYSRARNLQKGAREVCERFGGSLPADFEALRSITGIGEYTAGAIGSIAFGLKTPAVDGNVLRVVSRITGDARDVSSPRVRAEYRTQLAPLMPDRCESDFTQSLMELGALVCVPNGQPLCETCPVRAFCRAAEEGTTDAIPYKAPKKGRRIERRQVYLVLTEDGRVLVRKRPSRGLLSGLWEFVNLMWDEPLPPFLQGVQAEECLSTKHVFSHVEWHMQGYVCRLRAEDLPQQSVLATRRQLAERYAIPAAYSAFVTYLESILPQ